MGWQNSNTALMAFSLGHMVAHHGLYHLFGRNVFEHSCVFPRMYSTATTIKICQGEGWRLGTAMKNLQLNHTYFERLNAFYLRSRQRQGLFLTLLLKYYAESPNQRSNARKRSNRCKGWKGVKLPLSADMTTDIENPKESRTNK